MFLKILLISLAVISPGFSAVMVNFQKINSTTLLITIPQTVEWTTTVAGSSSYFIIKHAAYGAPGVNPGLSSTSTMDAGGPAIFIDDTWIDGMMGGDIEATDLVLRSTGEVTFGLGGLVRLTAGTITVPFYNRVTAPPSGLYDLMLMGDSLNYISGPAVAIPEPSAAVIALAGALGLLRRRRID